MPCMRVTVSEVPHNLASRRGQTYVSPLSGEEVQMYLCSFLASDRGSPQAPRKIQRQLLSGMQGQSELFGCRNIRGASEGSGALTLGRENMILETKRGGCIQVTKNLRCTRLLRAQSWFVTLLLSILGDRNHVHCVPVPLDPTPKTPQPLGFARSEELRYVFDGVDGIVSHPLDTLEVLRTEPQRKNGLRSEPLFLWQACGMVGRFPGLVQQGITHEVCYRLVPFQTKRLSGLFSSFWRHEAAFSPQGIIFPENTPSHMERYPDFE